MPLAVLALSGATCAQAQPAAPLKLERKIELTDVQGRIDHLSVDRTASRLYVAALGNDTLEVIDLKSASRVQTIRGLAEPQGVLVVPDADRLFVANGSDGSVRVFDSSSLAPLRTTPLGDDADNVRLDPASGHVWVGYGKGGLAELDAGGAKLADVPLGAHPESFQLEKQGPRIFVNLPNAKAIAVVERAKRAVIARWGTGDASANYPMALDEANKRLFVVCRTPARLLVLNTDSGVIAAALPTVGDADDVFYDATAKRLYVSGGEGALVAYRQDGPDRYTEIARLPTVKGARTSLFSPELGQLFLAVRREGPATAAVWVYAVSR